MKVRTCCLCIAGCLAALPVLVRADDPTAAKPAAAAVAVDGVPSWRKLFDGKSLAHWEATQFGGEGAVLVKDGLLVLEAGEPMTGVTWKGGELPKSNYELRMEAKRVSGSDFFLALTFPVQESHCSLVLGGWGGGVVGLSSINSFDASENETTQYESFTKDQWYKVRVRVTDAAVQVWLDDERIINVPTEGNRFSLRIEVDGNRPLGMSTYMTVGAYRQVEIRDLTAEERAAPADKN